MRWEKSSRRSEARDFQSSRLGFGCFQTRHNAIRAVPRGNPDRPISTLRLPTVRIIGLGGAFTTCSLSLKTPLSVQLFVLIFSPWPLFGSILVPQSAMGALQSSRMPSRAWLRYARAKKPAKSRSLRASWAVFILLGIPLGIMAVLGPLAYAGHYIEPLKQFWRPWPPDYVKGLLAVTRFAVPLRVPLYSHGREAGYQRGKTAGKAVARNIAEGLGGAVIEAAPVAVPPAPIEVAQVLVAPPVPPPP